MTKRQLLDALADYDDEQFVFVLAYGKSLTDLPHWLVIQDVRSVRPRDTTGSPWIGLTVQEHNNPVPALAT